MTTFEDIRETVGLRKSDILFTVGATTRINAPPKQVFDVITNLSGYSAWNQDTPAMEVLDTESLQEGSTVKMKVIMAEQSKEYDIPIKILKLENPNDKGTYVIAWRGIMLPTWFAVSERVQEVRPVEGDPSVCEVENFESMSGWGAYVFKYVMGIPGQMKRFNCKYLEDLKQRAETLSQ